MSNNKLMDVLNELLKPVLAVIIFIRDIISYALNLFSLCWRSACSGMNKDILIPSFITLFLIFFLYNIFHLIDFGLGSSDIGKGVYDIITIISLSIMGWGFTIIASIKKAKEVNKDSHWKKHLKIGFKSLRFFATYTIFIVLIIGTIMIVSSLGLIPNVGQTFLSLLSSPVFFLAVILLFSCISLLLGVALFGAYYCSNDYDDSLGFIDRTKYLFCMVKRKIIDCIAVSIPAFIISALFTLIPLLLMLVVLGDVIQKPTAGIFNEGQMFPGMVQDEHDGRDDSFQNRSLSFIGSRDYHSHYPSNKVINEWQTKFNDVRREYDMHQEDYNETILYVDAIKSLGFSTPGYQLDSIDAFESANPDSSEIEGVNIDLLRVVIEQNLYQGIIDDWSLKVKEIGDEKYDELSALGVETLDKYINELLKETVKKDRINVWNKESNFDDLEYEDTAWQDSWSFDSDDRVFLVKLDDWDGQKYVLNSNSTAYYSNYNKETDVYSDWEELYFAGEDGKVKYVGYTDSSFFIFLTHLFLAVSDALILAFPFMFFFASMGSIFYRLYNSSFNVNIFQKIIAIFLILATILVTTIYIEKEGDKFLDKIKENLIGSSGL